MTGSVSIGKSTLIAPAGMVTIPGVIACGSVVKIYTFTAATAGADRLTVPVLL